MIWNQLQIWVDRYRAWRAERALGAHGYWRSQVFRPWPEAVCWWCLAAIVIAAVAAWVVFR